MTTPPSSSSVPEPRVDVLGLVLSSIALVSGALGACLATGASGVVALLAGRAHHTSVAETTAPVLVVLALTLTAGADPSAPFAQPPQRRRL